MTCENRAQQRKTPQLVTDPHLQFDWRPALDARLYRAAERLVDAGCVSEIRVHQNGSIVTGVVRTEESTARHRIYIRRVNRSTPMQAECSCGARGACVHAAAVSIAAAHRRQEAALASGGSASPHALREPKAGTSLHEERAARQQLLYLLESDAQSVQPPQLRNLRLTIWISPTPGTGPGECCEAVAFAPRRGMRTRGQYPRYVDKCDEATLEILLAQESEGPWCLRSVSPHSSKSSCTGWRKAGAESLFVVRERYPLSASQQMAELIRTIANAVAETRGHAHRGSSVPRPANNSRSTRPSWQAAPPQRFTLRTVATASSGTT